MDLDERFGALTPRQGGCGEGRAVGVQRRQRHAAALVGVVRNGQHPALSGAGLLQPFPKALCRVPHLDRRASPGRNVLALEYDVAMKVALRGNIPGRELVGREGREAARLVEGVRMLLDPRPQMPHPLIAPVLRAFRTAADFGGAPQLIGARPVDLQERRRADSGAQLAADRCVVGRLLRVVTDLRLPEPRVMVGDGHEVQRYAQLRTHAAVVIQQGIAAAVAVRRRGIVPVAVGIRVERPARVDVQITKERRAFVRRRDSFFTSRLGGRHGGGRGLIGAGGLGDLRAAPRVRTGRRQRRDSQRAAAASQTIHDFARRISCRRAGRRR